ncbi:MAG: hypothetical protein HPY69_07325 [Armatimonadetes bacterium]|nr:hypothetical protein [Armatimonadota bacterium]
MPRLAGVALMLVVFGGCGQAQDLALRLDPQTRYQTILGWGKTTPWLPAPALLRDQVIDRAVNDLGLNRLRFEGMCGNKVGLRSWEWENDNADPQDINWSGFSVADLDARVAAWVVPWKQAVEARGEKLNLYVSPSFFQGGSSGDLPPWMGADPQEYAEWIVAMFLRLRDTHGINPDFLSICNEAGNNNVFSPQFVLRMARATVPRLRALGFPTRLQFPECVNAQVAWDYVQALRSEADLWDWIGLVSYHWYGNDNQAYMARLRDFALARGLPTAQTEFMDLTIDHLYDDLTIGGTSYWEVYGLAGPDYQAALSHISSTTFNGGQWYWRFRQVSHYVRPGAVRIGTEVSAPSVRALAFDAGGRLTVVLINTGPGATAQTVAVAGLPPGLYGVCQTVGRQAYAELGPQPLGGGEALRVTVPGDAVLTIYPRDEANLAPNVVAWQSHPDYLTLPASKVTLTAAATDPDRDTLACRWSVRAQPQGATVTLAEPTQATATVDGLAVPGEYAFAVQVSDGQQAVTREVRLKVFAGNQPPVPIDVHNRIPVRVTVADGGTLLRAGAWDVEGDPTAFRWSVVQQPRGATATLETPNKAECKVTGMTVPGEYRFRVQVSDPAHTVEVVHTVPVYP